MLTPASNSLPLGDTAKNLREIGKTLGKLSEKLRDKLKSLGHFLRTLGDFDRFPRKRKGFGLKGQRKTAHYGHVKPWCAGDVSRTKILLSASFKVAI